MLGKALAVAVLGALATTPLSAQRPNTRQGFWIGLGAGWGTVGADCSSCSNDRTGGGSGYLKMGGTISRSVLLGGESNGWFRSENNVDEGLAFATFIATFYPAPASAFFLKVGMGGMTYKASGGPFELRADAPAASLGLGYDIRVAPMFSLTPYVNFLGTSAVSFKLNGVTVPSGDDFKINLVQVGLGVSWH